MSTEAVPAAGSGEPSRSGLSCAVDALLGHIATIDDQKACSISPAQLGSELVRLQTAIDSLSGVAARWTKAFADQDGPADAGAGSLASWLRRELRVTGRDARRRVKTGRLLDRLRATAKSLSAGRIGLGHVHVLADAADELGSSVVAEAEPILLDVAEAADPDAVRTVVRRLRDTLDPDAADEAYVRALERRDVTITPVGDLYALRGLLDARTGEALKAVLYGLSKPSSKDDPRTAGQRKVDGLYQLCDERLRNGAPTDHGHRPHLLVSVTADRLTGAGSKRHEPAELHGYGTIGDSLLAELACDSVWTPIVTDDDGHVLDVGRDHRLATKKQRIAVFARQGGVCAAPGCRSTHLELHHRVWWSKGGNTNLKDLAGYCPRHHHLIHQHLLIVKPDGRGGWTHKDRHGCLIRDRWREADQAARDHLRALAAQAFDSPAEDDPRQQSDAGRPDAGRTDAADTGAASVDGKRLHDELKHHRRRRRRGRQRWRHGQPPHDRPPDDEP